MFRVASNRSASSAELPHSVDIRALLPAAAKAWRQLRKVLFDTYRPELHYLRGPGPKWRERHGALQTTPSDALVNRPTNAVIVAEKNVLRDERGFCVGKNCPLRAYASHRRDTMGQSATSPVLNDLSDTPATCSALAQVATALQAVLR